MTHEEISRLETRPYVFKIGDRGKGIEARYDKYTDVLIFPRIAFEYVVKMLQDALYEERNTGEWIKRQNIARANLETAVNLRWAYECSKCGYEVLHKTRYCASCGAEMRGVE